MNDGKGNFIWKDPIETGLYLRGEARDIKPIKLKDGNGFIVLQNNSVPLLYKINSTAIKN